MAYLTRVRRAVRILHPDAHRRNTSSTRLAVAHQYVTRCKVSGYKISTYAAWGRVAGRRLDAVEQA